MGDEAGQQPGVAPGARKRQVSLKAAVVIAAVSLGIGLVAGHAIAGADVQASQADAETARTELARIAEAHETLQERNWILYGEAEAALAEAAANAPSLPPGTYGDGVYVVGTDIQPGVYHGEVTGEWGYWARLNSTSGMISGILANAVVRGPFELTIQPADTAVELRGVTITAAE